MSKFVVIVATLGLIVTVVESFGSSAAAKQNYFVRISRSHKSGEDDLSTANTNFTARTRIECSGLCMALGPSECRGFSWERKADKCHILRHAQTRTLNLSSKGFDTFVSPQSVSCYDDSSCVPGGPLGAACVNNECGIACDHTYLEETPDGETCSLKIHQTWSSDKAVYRLRWYRVQSQGLFEGLFLDPDCAPVDACGILLSPERPLTHFHDFWPQEYNEFPRQQIFFGVNETGKAFLRYDAVVRRDGFRRRILEAVTDFDIADDVAFAVDAAEAGDGRFRPVAVKVMDAGGAYRDIAPPFQWRTANTRTEFYLSTPHNVKGATRFTRAPTAVAEAIEMMEDWRCNNNTHLDLTMGNGDGVPVCVIRRTRTAHPGTGQLSWFQFRRDEGDHAFSLEFWAKAEAAGSHFGVALSSAAEVAAESTTTVPFPGQHHDLRLTKSGGGFDVTLIKKTVCLEGAVNCAAGEVTIVDEAATVADAFDGTMHKFQLYYNYTAEECGETCELSDASGCADAFAAEWALYVDGVATGAAFSGASEAAAQQCYADDDGKLALAPPNLVAFDSIGIYGDATIELRGFAAPMLDPQ